MAKKPAVPLQDRLRNLDALLAKAAPAAFAAFRPGASPKALAVLEKKALAGKDLPDDLRVFFQWHDGQTKPASLSGEANWTPLSAAEALDAWTFLNHPKTERTGTWKDAWLPLFANGAGDYLVYETGGAAPGALRVYRHDGAGRAVAHASLEAWAAALEKEWKPAASAGAKASKKAAFAVDLTATQWKKATSPKQAALASKPVGTAYYYRRRYFAQPTVRWRVFVKVAPNAWYYAMSSQGLNEGFQDLCAIANKPRKPRDYEWKRDDYDMAVRELNAANVRADLQDIQAKQNKWSLDHVGLFEGSVKVAAP